MDELQGKRKTSLKEIIQQRQRASEAAVPALQPVSSATAPCAVPEKPKRKLPSVQQQNEGQGKIYSSAQHDSTAADEAAASNTVSASTRRKLPAGLTSPAAAVAAATTAATSHLTSPAPAAAGAAAAAAGFLRSPIATNSTQPLWDRRSRALRALDALEHKPHSGGQQQQQQQGSQGWTSPAEAAAARSGGGSTSRYNMVDVSMLGGHQADAEMWDKELADKAADLLWESDDEEQQQQQQQRQRKRKRSLKRQHTDGELASHADAAADADDVGLAAVDEVTQTDGDATAAAEDGGAKRRRKGGGSSKAATTAAAAAAATAGSHRSRCRSAAAAAASAAAAAAVQVAPDPTEPFPHDDGYPLADSMLYDLGCAAHFLGSAAAAAAGDAAASKPPAEPLLLECERTGLQLQVPGSITRVLRAYQREGVKFLFRLYGQGIGGVLSDDMGLGKTVQAIAFIAALLGKNGTLADAMPRSFAGYLRQQQQQQQHERHPRQGPASSNHPDGVLRWPILVVAPTSVLDNWLREFNTWGHFKVATFSTATASAVLERALLGTVEVVLISYDALRINIQDVLQMKPHAVIFDEVHKLKNPRSSTYEAAKELKTRYRYGLSGTIMPNKHEELWAVLDCLAPGCLGDYKSFSDYYSKPIKKGQSSTAKPYEMKRGAERLSHLQRALRKIYLRRTKAIIADQLPKKRDIIVFCKLKPLQYRAYDRTLASPDIQALKLAHETCDCGSGLHRGECCHSFVPSEVGGVLWPHLHMCDCSDPTCKRHRPDGCAEYFASIGSNARITCPHCLTLPAITLLQKISNHLDLIRPDAKLGETDERQFVYERRVAELVLGGDTQLLGGPVANSGGWLQASDETHCGKMVALQSLLSKWSSESGAAIKVLIFSRSMRCLDLLEAFVQRAGYDYVRLDGSTPQKARQPLVDEFNSRPSIFLFLMSTVAGGVGINLTAANKVVVFDPSWNPALDLQAQDRAYRLGQTRDVEVYRMVATGTLEELVYRRQVYKQQQSNMVLEGKQEARYWEGVQGVPDKPGELWGLQNLLRFSGHTVETRDIFQAYKQGSSQRQQLEQQLKEEVTSQQQQQQQQGDITAAAAAAAEDEDDKAPVAAASKQAGSSSKPYEILEVEQLVADPSTAQTLVDDILAGAAAFPEEAGDDTAAAAAAAVGASRGRKQPHPGQRLQGAIDGDENKHLGAQGNTAVAAAAAAAAGKRRRNKHQVIQDEDAETEFNAAAAADEDEELASDSNNGGSSSGGSSQQGEDDADTAAAAAAAAAAEATLVDPMMLELQQEGIVLHMHRHDKFLGQGTPQKPPQATASQDSHIIAEDNDRQHQQQQQQQQQHVPRSAAAAASPSAPAAARKWLQLHPTSAAAAATTTAAAAAAAGTAMHALDGVVTRAAPAVREAAATAADQGCQAVASLAVWRGLHVADMAEILLAVSAKERAALLQQYAAAVAG